MCSLIYNIHINSNKRSKYKQVEKKSSSTYYTRIKVCSWKMNRRFYHVVQFLAHLLRKTVVISENDASPNHVMDHPTTRLRKDEKKIR